MPHYIPDSELKSYLASEAEELKKSDPLGARINLGYLKFMNTDEGADDWIHEMRDRKLDAGQGFDLGPTTRHMRYLWHMHWKKRDPSLRPEDFPDADGCAELLDEIYSDRTEREELTDEFVMFKPRTSKPERAYAALLSSLVLRPDAESLKLVDFGSGYNAGSALLHIVTRPELCAYDDRLVLPPPPKLHSGSASEHNALDDLFQKARSIHFERAWGIDSGDPFDPLLMEYTRACSPTIRLVDADYQFMLTTMIGHAYTCPDIDFSLADVTKPGFYEDKTPVRGTYLVNNTQYEYFHAPPPDAGEADIAFSSFVMYLHHHNPEARKAQFDNMRALAENVVLLDAIEDIDNNPKLHPADRLKFANAWKSFSYRLVAFQDDQWHTLATARDGDFSRIKPGPLTRLMLRKAA